MSDVEKKYQIKIEADIKDAEKSIKELEQLFGDFAKKNQSTKALQNSVDQIKSEFKSLSASIQEQVKQINANIANIGNGKPHSKNKVLNGYADQVKVSVEEIKSQAELLKGFISSSDAGNFENFTLLSFCSEFCSSMPWVKRRVITSFILA